MFLDEFRTRYFCTAPVTMTDGLVAWQQWHWTRKDTTRGDSFSQENRSAEWFHFDSDGQVVAIFWVRSCTKQDEVIVLKLLHIPLRSLKEARLCGRSTSTKSWKD